MQPTWIVHSLLGLAATTSAQYVTDAELDALDLYWSYGRSEPFYPTPLGNGSGSWATSYDKARLLLAQLTNEEKNNITYGFTSLNTSCGGTSGSVPRVGFPGLCLQDAGNGVRGTDMVNGYPSGLHAGASWNRDLTYDRGLYMGAEFKAKGVSLALGPAVGPLGKWARGGRNWEGFSNDPYLAGSLAYETTVAMQKNVMTCIKHFLGNEQETNRMKSRFGTAQNASVSSNIDDKTVHELYLWPFQDAVKAGAISAMCSYQRFNNSYGCQNSHLMNKLLKHELGFQGFVVSDWVAQHTGVASAEAGLDMAMPNSPYWAGNLSKAVTNGTMSQARLDDMATRILASWYRLEGMDNKAFSDPGFGLPYDHSKPHQIVDARDPASKKTLFQGAVEGHVLVKNVRETLPLKSPKYLSLFGYDATAAHINTFQTRDYQHWALGLENALVFPNGTDWTAEAMHWIQTQSWQSGLHGPGIAMNGTLFTGGGSGATTPAYIDDPFSAFQRQAYEDNTFLSWDFHNNTPVVNQASEHCIVFVNELAGEGWDRPSLADSYSDGLILSVASQCNSTIVVVHNAGIRTVAEWVDNPNITAIIYGHLPGQDSGRALTEIMYGRQSPSGRLPYTVAKRDADYGTLLNPVVATGLNLFTQGEFPCYYHGAILKLTNHFRRQFHRRREHRLQTLHRPQHHTPIRIRLRPQLHNIQLLRPLHKANKSKPRHRSVENPLRKRRPHPRRRHPLAVGHHAQRLA
jgi:beta-glucosidase